MITRAVMRKNMDLYYETVAVMLAETGAAPNLKDARAFAYQIKRSHENLGFDPTKYLQGPHGLAQSVCTYNNLTDEAHRFPMSEQIKDDWPRNNSGKIIKIYKRLWAGKLAKRPKKLWSQESPLHLKDGKHMFRLRDVL